MMISNNNNDNNNTFTPTSSGLRVLSRGRVDIVENSSLISLDIAVGDFTEKQLQVKH